MRSLFGAEKAEPSPMALRKLLAEAIFMHLLRPSAVALCAFALLSFTSPVRAADSDWQKSYPVSAKPSLSVSTGDSSTEVRSCGSCREIRIRVEWRDRRASEYNLVESQSGDHVEFVLHEKQRIGFRMNLGNRREPHVTVDTPASLDLEARTSDGALSVTGVQGELQLRTSDGSLDASDVSGALSITASDGSIRVHNASGTLESHSSDGSVRIDGRFSGVQVKTSDGSLDFTLAEGSKLTTASRIESSDGSVAIHLPRSLSADMEIHTGDGHIDCKLPLTMEGYNSSGDSHHNLRGRLNGGGVPLDIHTQDGSVTIAAL